MNEIITKELINNLITCQKVIEKSERKNMQVENRSFRNNIFLFSKDKKYTFTIFLRKSCVFEEDFSVGLKWTNADKYIDIHKDIILFRCQGPHDTKSPLDIDTHHSYHTHMITVKDIEEYRYTKPESKSPCKEFNSFETAIVYFCKKCGIIELDKYINIKLPTEGMQYELF